jgi:hypothetical protein
MIHDLVYATIMLLFVISLIFITAAVFKKFRPTDIFNKNNLGKSKRLNLEEVLIIDHQSKLILIKRDDVNHLLLINKDSSIVIESDIK